MGRRMKSAIGGRKPAKTDVSRPKRAGDYGYKRKFYRDAEVAADYDFHRFGSRSRQKRNLRKWKTIRAALELTSGVSRVLDLPCGTGRFTAPLALRGYQVIGSDVSIEMMQQAKSAGRVDGVNGYLQADAKQLPLRTGCVDCVMSIRFLMHVDSETRVRMLREMRRVSRRWLILDYRHRYSHRYAVWCLKRLLGLTKQKLPRVTRAQVEGELGAAGLSVRKIIPVAVWFSDKWIVVGEPTTPGS